MFKDKDLIINTTEKKLLYDIRQLLTEQNDLLKDFLKPDIKTKPENNEKIPCKYCGGEHDNKGQVMACAKKNKKEAQSC